MQENHFVAFADGGKHGLFIVGQEGAQINDLQRNPFLSQLFRGFERGPHHGAIRNHSDVSPLARDPSLADGHGVIALGHFVLDTAVEEFVLEVEHRVVVADGGLDQSLGVVSGRGHDDFEPRRVHEPHLVRL